MRVFLTGGTGLLGSHVAQTLRDGGHEVVALFRSGAEVGFLRALGCELVEGSVTDPSGVQSLRMGGCSALVHAAAMMYGAESFGASEAVNVDGTRRVLEGARDAGVTQAVHISSVAVYGDQPGPITEDLPLEWPLRIQDYYARTKRAAEQVARGIHAEGRVGVTVLRPPALYGERDRWLIPQLIALVKGVFVPLPGGGRTRFPAVYAGNVAQAVELALWGRGSGGVFNITDESGTTLRRLFEGLAGELALRPRFVTIPAALARTGAGFAEALGLRISGARDLSLKRTVRLASEDNPYSSGKARTVLGWSPHFTLEEALSRTGAWIREREGSNDSR